MSGKANDLTGKRFVHLRVVKRGETRNEKAYWICECDCGDLYTVRADRLVLGVTTMCKKCSDAVRFQNRKTHGESHTRLYKMFHGMRARCYNPNATDYCNYGGRGITICKEWESFEVFKAWALANGYDEAAAKGECTIDRIDVNGNYGPNNCRFVTMKVQSNNKRCVRKFTYKGETHTIPEWAAITGIPVTTLWHRINTLSWSVEDALSRKRKDAGDAKPD